MYLNDNKLQEYKTLFGFTLDDINNFFLSYNNSEKVLNFK